MTPKLYILSFLEGLVIAFLYTHLTFPQIAKVTRQPDFFQNRLIASVKIICLSLIPFTAAVALWITASCLLEFVDP